MQNLAHVQAGPQLTRHLKSQILAATHKAALAPAKPTVTPRGTKTAPGKQHTAPAPTPGTAMRGLRPKHAHTSTLASCKHGILEQPRQQNSTYLTHLHPRTCMERSTGTLHCLERYLHPRHLHKHRELPAHRELHRRTALAPTTTPAPMAPRLRRAATKHATPKVKCIGRGFTWINCKIISPHVFPDPFGQNNDDNDNDNDDDDDDDDDNNNNNNNNNNTNSSNNNNNHVILHTLSKKGNHAVWCLSKWVAFDVAYFSDFPLQLFSALNWKCHRTVF